MNTLRKVNQDSSVITFDNTSAYFLFNFDETFLKQVLEIEVASQGSPWSEKLLKLELENERSVRIAIVTDDGKLIGYSFNHLIEDELHVLNIVVADEFRKKGCGRALLSSCLKEAKQRSAQRALLEVRPSNTSALGLYRSLGFKIIAKRKEYYRDNLEDALMLELQF